MKKVIRPRWTGTVVGIMHLYGIKQRDLAKHMGMTENYISMILSGSKTPAGAARQVMDALSDITGIPIRDDDTEAVG